ncbi:MAG: CoA transferase [Actinomycetota bacterium]|jgi:crotonobetainyl-CoA:carnitine CoA-transferase CaiB-like acyl-CoA transferase
MKSALSPYRVVELAAEENALCGFLLATLGAEVISIEAPPGSGGRAPERLLWHQAYNRGKYSVVVDLAGTEGRDRLRSLVAGADIFVESAGQQALAPLGLAYAELAARNPALVYVSLSAFGTGSTRSTPAGPAPDLAVLAASGALLLGGDGDRAPCRLSVPQAWLHAAGAAAGGALVALYERNRSGRGQHVDISAQQVNTIGMGGWSLAAPANAPSGVRAGGGVRSGNVEIRFVWPAADGHVSITHLFGPAFGPATRRLMEWVHEAGFCDEAMRDKDWIAYGLRLHTGEEPPEAYAGVQAAIAAFTASRTRQELFDGARDRRVFLAPVNDMSDVSALEHFSVRHYWDVDADGVRFPGPWARFSGTPLTSGQSVPRPGEHTGFVLGGGDRRPAVGQPDPEPPELPLSGVKVLDFTWAFAGPTTTRALADFGATVVKVESTRAVDAARTVMPFVDNEPGPERSAIFASLNAGKRSITLDLSRPEGLAIVHDLVRWADVVIESFSPKAMKRWGLDYDHLRVLNPDLIMLSTCLMGQTGPLASFAGWGNLAGALCGFTRLLGWPDRAPAGPYQAYTDYVAPHFMLVAILAALDARRRAMAEGAPGGQYIDFSQAEGALHFLTPALLDYAINGRVAAAQGNDDPQWAPHGVYRAAGDDDWVAVICPSDECWPQLAKEIGRPDLGGDPGLATTGGRRGRRAEIDAAIEAWTADQKAEAIRPRLVAIGVWCEPAATSAALTEDPDLLACNQFVEVDHSACGRIVIEGNRYRLSHTPGQPTHGGPTLGEHLFEVLHDVLGYPEERISDLVMTGVFE